mmetsp:Transcript_300/g.499  ORF Transcript_300/g.499 Transcript_300/m.499 type:complete len:243 (+) Transcript_300:104-832(+)
MNALHQSSLRYLLRNNQSISNKLRQFPALQITRNGHTVKVILTSDLPDGKGYAGDVLTVKAGYARNHLIPLKKALYATPTNFERARIPNPDLVSESAEERKMRESKESDADLKAADFLRYYLRNKTLKIWRTVDMNAVSSTGSIMGAPIHPGMVDHGAVRQKLSKQLMVDLEEHEKVQIYPEPVAHHLLEEESLLQEYFEKMEPLKEGQDCNVQLKALGEYLVKIHLQGDQSVALRLAVLKR